MLSASSLDQLKAADPDRCRAAVFADSDGRERLLLFYAFHYELAKVPEWVSEPMVGKIRYQWWRDAVAEIYEGKPVRKHEITTPLAEMAETADIPRFWLDRLIDGRERDLDPRPFANITEAKDYCRQTSGILMQVAVKLLGAEPNESVLAAGEAWGLTGLARAYRYYQGGMLNALDYGDICEAAAGCYGTASKRLQIFPSESFAAFAYVTLIPKYLAKLTDKRHDPLNDVVILGPLAKRIGLMGAVLRGRV